MTTAAVESTCVSVTLLPRTLLSNY